MRDNNRYNSKLQISFKSFQISFVTYTNNTRFIYERRSTSILWNFQKEKKISFTSRRGNIVHRNKLKIIVFLI